MFTTAWEVEVAKLRGRLIKKEEMVREEHSRRKVEAAAEVEAEVAKVAGRWTSTCF